MPARILMKKQPLPSIADLKKKWDYVIGVDPGGQGGIAIIDATHADVAVHGLSNKTEDAIVTIIEQVCVWGDPVAAIESVGGWPSDAASAAFNFGKAYGLVRGVFRSNRIPFVEVPPQTWQRTMALGRVTGDRKKAHRAKAEALFPALGEISLEKADSLLIAEHLWRFLTYE